MARTCPQCGKEYSDDDRFCTVDGAALISAGGANSLIGTVLADRYLVQERLGEGGMGEVYLAEHVRIKRKVAVKLMRTWMVGDPVAVSRFHREAENASQISHPNVAQVYDFGETADGMIYLAMEYVPGEPLSSILERERRLNVVRTGEMVRQTAEALVAAHGMGILHRDLKPDNIMVARTRAGTDMVKLVDFGIARVMSRGTQQFTSTGMIVGTPDYMSPEQLTGDSLDERSDLYALALIAFRVLTGESAFKSNVAGDAFIARMMGKPRTLADVLPDVAWPAALQAAFDKALAADPAARHADAMEFVAEFDGAIDQIPLNEEEQAYLLLVSQRMATPSRGGMIVDSSTPVRSMSAVRAAGGLSPTPTTGQPPVGVATPPSESQAMPRPALQPTVQLAGAAVPPVSVPPVRSETPVVPAAAAADASRTTTPTPPPPASPIAARDDTQPASIVVRDATPAVPHPAVVAAPPAAASPRRGPPLGVIAAAALGVAVLGYAATRLGGGKDETAAPPAAALVDSTLNAAPAETADTLAASALPAAASADSERVQRARGAVLSVMSANGRGSAFAVDSAGLLVTAASLVPADRRIDVFVDADNTVHATVVSVDSATGLAALLVSPRVCRRCRALDVGQRDTMRTATAVGDSLLALPAVRRNTVTPQPVVVARTTASTFATATSVGTSALGAPILNPRSGSVAGIVARRRGNVVIANAAALRALVATARPAASRLTTNDSLFRTWPARAVGASELTAAEAASFDLAGYRATQGGFDVLAMTPQLLAWRLAQSAPPAVEDNPFEIGAKTPGGPPDPLLEWKSWRAYREERRAVVIFHVAPDKAAYPQRPDKPLDARKGDFYSLTITRDGTPLVPLESQTIHAVGNVDMYRREKKAIPNAGIYVFHPADFAAASATYQVVIVDADQKRRVTMALPATMLQSIAKDLGPWQR